MRLDKNLTQKQLGDILKVGTTSVSDWETRGYEPSYQTLINLAIYFNVTVGQLVGTEEWI